MTEFGIVERPCYFCGQEKTVRFDEHYTFCPSCAAIYTRVSPGEGDCEHSQGGVIQVRHRPWYKDARAGKVYSEDYKCSICGGSAVGDGW